MLLLTAASLKHEIGVRPNQAAVSKPVILMMPAEAAEFRFAEAG